MHPTQEVSPFLNFFSKACSRKITSKRHLCFWIASCIPQKALQGHARIKRHQDAQLALLKKVKDHEACLDIGGEVPQAAIEEFTRVGIRPNGNDPPTSSIHPEWTASQLTVNLCNVKLVKVTSHRKEWWWNSSVCCSQLCDSHAAFSYRVTDLSASHAPFFLVSTKLRT